MQILWSLLQIVLIGVAVSQVATFATTVYLHRTLAHRALTLAPPVAWAFRLVIWLTVGIKPREWAAVHRKHHAFTDVEGDPHSPKLLGWKKVQLANPALYRQVARDGTTVARYAKDLRPDAWDRVLFDRAWVGLGIGVAVLVVLFGPVVGVLGAVLHTLLYLQLNSAVNAVGHTFGKRPYDNSGTNLQSLALVTGGEGLHNNHHAAPTSATFALHKGEVDVSWPAIWLMTKLRLATVRHDVVRLKGSGRGPGARPAAAADGASERNEARASATS